MTNARNHYAAADLAIKHMLQYESIFVHRSAGHFLHRQGQLSPPHLLKDHYPRDARVLCPPSDASYSLIDVSVNAHGREIYHDVIRWSDVKI